MFPERSSYRKLLQMILSICGLGVKVCCMLPTRSCAWHSQTVSMLCATEQVSSFALLALPAFAHVAADQATAPVLDMRM